MHTKKYIHVYIYIYIYIKKIPGNQTTGVCLSFNTFLNIFGGVTIWVEICLCLFLPDQTLHHYLFGHLTTIIHTYIHDVQVPWLYTQLEKWLPEREGVPTFKFVHK